MKVSLLQELLTLPEHLDSVPVFSRVRVARYLVFCTVFCRSLFVILVSFLSLFYCLYLSRLGLANGRNSVIQWMGLKILLLQIVFSLQGVWYFSILRHVVHLIGTRQPAVAPLSEGLYHNDKLYLLLLVEAYFPHPVRPSVRP